MHMLEKLYQQHHCSYYLLACDIPLFVLCKCSMSNKSCTDTNKRWLLIRIIRRELHEGNALQRRNNNILLQCYWRVNLMASKWLSSQRDIRIHSTSNSSMIVNSYYNNCIIVS